MNKSVVIALVFATTIIQQTSCQQLAPESTDGSGDGVLGGNNYSYEDYYTGYLGSGETGSDDYYPGVWDEDDIKDEQILENVELDLQNSTLIPPEETTTDETIESTVEDTTILTTANPEAICPSGNRDGNQTSPGFPKPYPNQVNCRWSYSVETGAGIEIIVHQLNISHKTDYLIIKPGFPEETNEKGIMLTGYLEKPYKLLIPHRTTFTVEFVSNHTTEDEEPQPYPGYWLTYEPFGKEVSPVPPTTTEAIVPQEELQWIQQTISILKSKLLVMSTWDRVKEALANATTEYLEYNGIWAYQPARAKDIKLEVRRCPESWPNYEECATLKFAIPLRPNMTESSLAAMETDPEGISSLSKATAKGFITLTSTVAPELPYELSEEHLEEMWNLFGAKALVAEGIEAYRLQESSSVVFIWIAISLCVLAAFIFVLYSIWKIDIFKDYRRITKMRTEAPDDDRSELKKKEFDISMFPSPHQIVPSLFPTGEPFAERRNTDALYAYDNSTMNPWAEEDNEDFRGRPQRSPTKTSYEPFSPAPLDFSPTDFDSPSIQNDRGARENSFMAPPFQFPRNSREEAPGPRKFSSQA